MSDCERCLSLLDSYIDHELAEDERLFVEKHLEQCPQCRAEWQEAKALEERLAAWAAEEIEPPADFREKVFARLEAEPAPVVPLSTRAVKKKPLWSKVLPWAAAAVLLLAMSPAIIHLAGGQPGNSSQPQQVAENDQAAKQTQDEQAPRMTPAETAPAEKPQPAEKLPAASDEPASKEQPPVQKNAAEQEDTGSTQPELTVPENDSIAPDDKTPMLASGSQPDEQQMPTEETQPQLPAPAFYRSSAPEEPDWSALKEQDTALKQKYSEELDVLKQQYAQEATEELQAAITAKEAELEAIDKRLKAIENKDAQAYDEALANAGDE